MAGPAPPRPEPRCSAQTPMAKRAPVGCRQRLAAGQRAEISISQHPSVYARYDFWKIPYALPAQSVLRVVWAAEGESVCLTLVAISAF
jgi:hypothetical protein